MVGAQTPPEMDPIKSARPAYFPEAGWYVETPVYDRYHVMTGMRFDGPAIFEERESTTVIGPRARITVDARRNLLAEPGP